MVKLKGTLRALWGPFLTFSYKGKGLTFSFIGQGVLISDFLFLRPSGSLCSALGGWQCCFGGLSVAVTRGHNTPLCALCSLLLSLQLLPGASSRESEFYFCLNWDRFYVGTRC